MNKIINEKQRKKRRILHASIKIFTKKGFQETTIENITRKPRVEKGTFLQLFWKKEDALIYFLDDEINKSRQEIDLKINASDDFLDQPE